jgi:hypothetical protein
VLACKISVHTEEKYFVNINMEYLERDTGYRDIEWDQRLREPARTGAVGGKQSSESVSSKRTFLLIFCVSGCDHHELSFRHCEFVLISL